MDDRRLSRREKFEWMIINDIFSGANEISHALLNPDKRIIHD